MPTADFDFCPGIYSKQAYECPCVCMCVCLRVNLRSEGKYSIVAQHSYTRVRPAASFLQRSPGTKRHSTPDQHRAACREHQQES